MTTNEQVAKVMNWVSPANNTELNTLEWWDDLNYEVQLVTAKALQQRMVEDGWDINITQYAPTNKFVAWANRETENMVMADVTVLRKSDDAEIHFDTEPAAIVSLFCKVYKIEVEHE